MTSELNINSSFHGLKLLVRCGGGAYGDVYYCQDISGRYMAVKIIDKQKFGDSWERELKGVIHYRKITEEHPALMQIYHVSEDETTFYYTMEPADSSDAVEYRPDTLARRLDRGPLPTEEQFAVISGIFAGIRTIHEAGFAHRDVKPDNIIFVKGIPKLGDIGLMSSLASTMTTFAGTLDFVPPEQRGSRSDDKHSRQKSDFYAFGKVIYCIITGCTPDKFPDIPADLPVTPNLKFFLRLVFRLCDRDPLRRIASIEATAKALAEIEFKLRCGETAKDRILLLIKDTGLFLRVMGQHAVLNAKKHYLLASGALLFAALTGYAALHAIFHKSGDEKLLENLRNLRKTLAESPEKFKKWTFRQDRYSLQVPADWQFHPRSELIQSLKEKYTDPDMRNMQLKKYRHVQALITLKDSDSYIRISCIPRGKRELEQIPENDLQTAFQPFLPSDIQLLSVRKLPPRDGYDSSFMAIGTFPPDGHLVSRIFPQEHHSIVITLNQKGNLPDQNEFVRFGAMMEYFKVNDGVSTKFTADPDGRTPFMLAVADSDFKQAEQLLVEGSNIDETAYDGSTALHLAAEDGALDAVQFLLEHKADIHAADHLQMTPLIISARECQASIMEVLLKAGSDPEQRDFRHYTALCHAVSESHPKCVKLLLEAGAKPDIIVHPVLKTPLIMLAAAQKDPEVMKLLLEHRIDLRAVNGLNENALLRVLHIAVSERDAARIAMANLLIRAGIDVNHADEQGRTALMYAAALGNKELVQKLLEHGAKKELKDAKGLTAFSYCDGQKYPEIKKNLTVL